MSDSLRPHESQHARPPCPSPTPGVHSDSRPLSQWCHPAISSSVIPFSSCPQSLPAMSQLFTWGGQSTGVSIKTIFNSSLGFFKKIIWPLSLRSLEFPKQELNLHHWQWKQSLIIRWTTRAVPRSFIFKDRNMCIFYIRCLPKLWITIQNACIICP